jgi:uncharacterized protein YcaQ
MELTLADVRAILLATQGLLAPPPDPAGKDDVLAAIRRMGALQIDSINVVARSQYLVLWSRLGCYEPRWLDELLAEGKLFEYWAHAACFLPIEDFPLYRRRMLDTAGWRSHAVRWAHGWLAENGGAAERMRAHIREARRGRRISSAPTARPGAGGTGRRRKRRSKPYTSSAN